MRFLHHLHRAGSVCVHVNKFQWVKWLCLPLKCPHNEPPPAPAVGSVLLLHQHGTVHFIPERPESAWPLYVVSLRPELFYLLYSSLNKRSILSPKTKWISSLLPLHSAAAFYCNKSAFTTSHIMRNTREGASSCEWVSTASNEEVSGWVVVELKIVNMNGRRAVDIIMIMKVLAKWIFFLLFEARQLHLIPDIFVRGWKAMALIPRMSTRQYYLSVLQLSV